MKHIPSRRLTVALGIVALVAMVAGLATGLLTLDRQLTPMALALPDLELPYLPGASAGQDTTGNLRDLRGPALLNLWASWCYGCRLEHGLLQDMAAQGTAIYGLNFMDRADAARQWLDRHGSPYRAVYVDVLGNATVPLAVTGLPQTLLIGANGDIVLRVEGALNADTVESLYAAGLPRPDPSAHAHP